MSITSSAGPLQELVHLYQRLQADPKSCIAEYGFSREKIHFQVEIESDGTGARFVDIRKETEKGKKVPQLLVVPDRGGRSGTSIKPYFCWDNSGYVLGRDNKGKPARAEQQFAAFRDFHLSMLDDLSGDVGYLALCKFLKSWNPSQSESIAGWEEISGLNLVFRLRGVQQFIHQSPTVQEVWLKRQASAPTDESSKEAPLQGTSLVSGQQEVLARLHPLIGGVVNANTMGAAIVSFNLDAFESYGRTQSYNAPVGIRDTFRYTTALNHLLSENSRRFRVGDATVVYWTNQSDRGDFDEVLAAFFGQDVSRSETKTAEDAELGERIRCFLERASQGLASDEMSGAPSRYYALGLAPNASRLNVRFWMSGSVNELAVQLAEHEANLSIIGKPPVSLPLSVRSLLEETARDPKDVPPQLAGEFARSIFLGLAYPRSLLLAVMQRIRAESKITYRRAALLKACLIKSMNMEISVSLNKDHSDEAYQLGRLFAVLEKTQEDASNGSLNSTIKDRFFGSASCTPASVFPRLLKLYQHHLEKLDPPGKRINREKLVGEIMGRICKFPSFMSLEKQGLFYIAYYHQRQDFFQTKITSLEEAENE